MIDDCTGCHIAEWSSVTKEFNAFNPLPHSPDFQRPPRKKPFENIVGKGENAGNQHFLLFPQCFLSYQRQKPSFELHLFCRLQMPSIWSHPKFCCLVKS